MGRFDVNKNGELELPEFRMLVNDIASTGKLKIRREFQHYMDRTTLSDSPWALELSADKKLQGAVKDLRMQVRRAGSTDSLAVQSGSSSNDLYAKPGSFSRRSSDGTVSGGRGLCGLLDEWCIPVLHPESRFRFSWGLGTDSTRICLRSQKC
eukprot:3545417-Prymnesium_polylepis.1